MANDQNLIPPKKGEVRNPKGNPGAVHSKTILSKYLPITIERINPISEQPEKLSLFEHLWLVRFAAALNGDWKAMDQILDRLEGKPLQSINADIEQHNADPLQVIITSDVRLTRDTEEDEPNVPATTMASELE